MGLQSYSGPHNFHLWVMFPESLGAPQIGAKLRFHQFHLCSVPSKAGKHTPLSWTPGAFSLTPGLNAQK